MESHNYTYLTLEECYYIHGANEVDIICDGDNKKLILSRGECKGQVKEKTQLKGSIYLLECGGKYKIGISKNVDRRIKELDNRPFKVNKIISKDNVVDVYSKEQKLHTKYSKKRIDGEWYEFNQEELKNIIDEIKGL